MAFVDPVIGRNTQQALIERIVQPTPVIQRVCAYPRMESDGGMVLVVHIVSDNGPKDAVVKRLVRRAWSHINQEHQFECTNTLRNIKWIHSETVRSVPKSAQILYVRQPPLESDWLTDLEDL